MSTFEDFLKIKHLSVAFYGPNGSGRSTLRALLLEYIDLIDNPTANKRYYSLSEGFECEVKDENMDSFKTIPIQLGLHRLGIGDGDCNGYRSINSIVMVLDMTSPDVLKEYVAHLDDIYYSARRYNPHLFVVLNKLDCAEHRCCTTEDIQTILKKREGSGSGPLCTTRWDKPPFEISALTKENTLSFFDALFSALLTRYIKDPCTWTVRVKLKGNYFWEQNGWVVMLWSRWKNGNLTSGSNFWEMFFGLPPEIVKRIILLLPVLRK